MDKFSVWDRIGEISKLPKDIRGCHGMYFNQSQFRLEINWDGRVVCWCTVDMLVDLGKKEDEYRKSLILGLNSPLRGMLADFFYPGWQLSYYMKHGKRAPEL